jgi:hypothetical protein
VTNLLLHLVFVSDSRKHLALYVLYMQKTHDGKNQTVSLVILGVCFGLSYKMEVALSGRTAKEIN